MLYVYMDNFIILILTGNIYVDIPKMLKKDMILQIVKLKNYYLEGKKKYLDQWNMNEVGKNVRVCSIKT